MKLFGILYCTALVACSSHATNPTLLVMNVTSTQLAVVVYDYTVPVNGPPGIYIGGSPEYTLGQVNGSGSACLTFAGVMISHAFVLLGEDSLGVQTPATNTFVPWDSPGWTVTFTGNSTSLTGPTKVSTGCSPTP